MNRETYIGLDVHQATISVAVIDSKGKVSDGIHPGDKGFDYSRVLCGTPRDFGGDLGRRNLGRLVVRSTQAPCGARGGVQSAQERSAQTRKQE
jgi:hypothetical protein